MCITDSLCCKPETNTTLRINYTAIKVKNKPKSHKVTCNFEMGQ